MEPFFNAEELQILNGTDMPKQKQLTKDKLDAWQGTNIEDFHWQCLEAIQTNKKKQNKELKVYKRPKDDIEEKKESDFQNNEKSVSVLIDFEKGREEGGYYVPKEIGILNLLQTKSVQSVGVMKT